MATIVGCNTAQARQITDCLSQITTRLETAAIPEAKRRKLKERVETSAVIHCGGVHCAPGTAAYTDSAGSPNIHICRETFGMRDLRLCGVIFHELVHSCGSQELDAEVMENIVYPPDEGGVGKGGGTWPIKDLDCPDFCARTKVRSDGLREDEYFIWDPRTGDVWEKSTTGDRGRRIWDDPAIRARFRCDCPPREQGVSIPAGPLVDPTEPGDFPEGAGPREAEGIPDDRHVLIDPIEPGSFPGEDEVLRVQITAIHARLDRLSAEIRELRELVETQKESRSSKG